MAYFARAVRAKLLELPNVRMSSIYVLYTFIGFKNCFKFHSHTVSYCFYIRKISFGEKVKHFFCLILRISRKFFVGIFLVLKLAVNHSNVNVLCMYFNNISGYY